MIEYKYFLIQQYQYFQVRVMDVVLIVIASVEHLD